MKDSKLLYGIRDNCDFIGAVWETELGLIVSHQGKLDLNSDLQIRCAKTQEDIKNVDLRNVLMSILPINE